MIEIDNGRPKEEIISGLGAGKVYSNGDIGHHITTSPLICPVNHFNGSSEN